MKPNESFPYLLNELFGELQSASRARIAFTMTPIGAHDGEKRPIRIMSVNGFKSPGTYTQHIQFLKSELLAALADQLKQMDVVAGRYYLSQAAERSRRLFMAVIPLSDENRNKRSACRFGSSWGFYRPGISQRGGHRGGC